MIETNIHWAPRSERRFSPQRILLRTIINTLSETGTRILQPKDDKIHHLDQNKEVRGHTGWTYDRDMLTDFEHLDTTSRTQLRPQKLLRLIVDVSWLRRGLFVVHQRVDLLLLLRHLVVETSSPPVLTSWINVSRASILFLLLSLPPLGQQSVDLGMPEHLYLLVTESPLAAVCVVAQPIFVSFDCWFLRLG